MKLAKLLAAGKSFVVAGDGVHRYRLNRAALPRFISPRNPFAPPPAPDAPAAEEQALDRAAAAGHFKPPRSGSAPRGASGSVARIAGRVRQWLRELKGRIAARRGRTDAVRLGDRSVPVQREFSLDQVRVVRNDLRDEDIEVVLARPAAGGPVVGGKAATPARWGVVGRAWERLSSRFSTATQG